MTAAQDLYPVRVDASLDPPLSRWLWLVKWVLLIPHYIVLAFLWMAFAVVSVIAFFAILFTERYPRGLFDFSLGVLRWTWRVHYYAYGALGTDRYPPFSLSEHLDYPAHLDIPYPLRLSRRLVLVKWWLLALPHYLILSVLVGGGLSLGQNANNAWVASGLLGLLVCIAAISLLFRSSYPQSLYRLIMGINRWALRVTAYAALMTDTYPPFRLDQGGAEPEPRPLPSVPATRPLLPGTAPG